MTKQITLSDLETLLSNGKMKVVLDIPDVLLDEIDDSISTMTNNHCQSGSLPSDGAWSIFQGIWFEALEEAKKRENGVWRSDYQNDVQINEVGDEVFESWWDVTDGSRVCRCESESDAEWLVGVLNGLAGA